MRPAMCDRQPSARSGDWASHSGSSRCRVIRARQPQAHRRPPLSCRRAGGSRAATTRASHHVHRRCSRLVPPAHAPSRRSLRAQTGAMDDDGGVRQKIASLSARRIPHEKSWCRRRDGRRRERPRRGARARRQPAPQTAHRSALSIVLLSSRERAYRTDATEDSLTAKGHAFDVSRKQRIIRGMGSRTLRGRRSAQNHARLVEFDDVDQPVQGGASCQDRRRIRDQARGLFRLCRPSEFH